MLRFTGLIAGLLIATATLQPAYADSKEDKIRELIAISGAGGTLEVMRAPMTQQLEGQLNQALPNMPDEHRQELLAVVNEEFDKFFPKFIDHIVPLYAETFTEEEISDVVAFFKTPSGQAFAEKQPQMMLKSMRATQEWGRQFGQRVTERLKAKAQELGYNL